MRFSIVIPTFNRAHLLPAALESVFAQETPPHEVIVVDDGSTDETLNVLRGFGNRIVVVAQQNSGPAQARNAGIARARGECVAFLDSDDLWFPWTLATYAEAFARHGEPALVSGTHVDFGADEDPPSPDRTGCRDAVFTDYFATARLNLWIGTCGAAIRTESLRKAGGFARHAFNAEDSDLWLRLGAEPGFVRIESPPVFARRRHADSAIASAAQTARGVLAMIESERQGRYAGGSARARERREIITRHARPACLAALRSGAREEAAALYRQTFAWHLGLRRARFLFAAPLLAAARILRR